MSRHRPASAAQTAHRRLVLAVAVAVVASLVLGGCVPEAVGPTASSLAGGSAAPTASPVQTGPTPSPSFVPPTPTPMPTFFVYTVVRGDTLLSIARSFRTTARSIAYWNRGTYASLDPESSAYQPGFLAIGWALRLIPGSVVDEQALPGLTPAPAATPGGSGQPFATEPILTPAPGAGAIVASHGPYGGTWVALTFDLDGRTDSALAVVDWLTANGIRATILAGGTTSTGTATGRRVVAKTAGRPDLFDLGNLSWDEPAFTDLDAAAVADQLNRTETAIAGLAAVTTKPWFRPPSGVWDEDVRVAVGSAGWAYLVMWDIDTNDATPSADGGPSALDIETKVLSRVEGGSIVHFHLGGFNTLDALPGIVVGLRAKGLEPVTLTELLLR